MFLQRISAHTYLFSFSFLSLLACQPSKQAEDQELIGITRRAEEIKNEEAIAQRETRAPKSQEPQQVTYTSPKEASTEVLNEWARKKMAEQVVETNALGLASRIVATVADLPWNLIIENRSEKDVNLAALPQLLSFEIADTHAPEDGSSKQKSSADLAKEDAYLCKMKKPKKVKDSQLLRLKPKGILVYSFDPRAYCEDTSKLAAGSRVTAFFGFRPKTKKVWRRGKRVEIKLPPKAPFAALLSQEAKPDDAPDEMRELLGWNIDSFLLGETYPLESLSALAKEELPIPEETEDPTQTSDAANSPKEKQGQTPSQSGEQAIESPLKLTISDISRTRNPSRRNLRARVRNVSKKTIRVLIKREAFSFQFDSPKSHITCGLPADENTSPRSRYTSLKPGQSRLITIRLSEACQVTSWVPGDYKITGTYALTSSPAPGNDQYYMGSVTSAKPGKLKVIGASSEPIMTVLP